MRKKPLLIGKDEFGRAETGLYLFVGNRSAFGLIVRTYIYRYDRAQCLGVVIHEAFDETGTEVSV
jgi:hypothetical protein